MQVASGSRLDKSELEILKNDSETLTATLVPANTTDDRTVTWSTNAEDVATVNQSGRVTGKKKNGCHYSKGW